MMNIFQAMAFGALQGITELFPISSLGHSVILPGLLHWNIDQESSYFLPFLVLTHLATAIVLLCFFWRDWYNIIGGVLVSLRDRALPERNVYGRVGWLLAVGTVPAGILGFLFQHRLEVFFSSPKAVAGFLMLNGVLLLCIEALRRRSAARHASDDDRSIARLSVKKALTVGLMQCLALIPGFSRTGATLGGGILVGLSHEESARFSFWLATPIIFAAAILKVPHLAEAQADVFVPALVGAFFSGAAAYLSVRFLTRYFKTKTLIPFGIYCLLAGALALFLI